MLIRTASYTCPVGSELVSSLRKPAKNTHNNNYVVILYLCLSHYVIFGG